MAILWDPDAADELEELPEEYRQAARNAVTQYINQELSEWEDGKSGARSVEFKPDGSDESWRLDIEVMKNMDSDYVIEKLTIVPTPETL
ncbi:MAG: hypothetical protein A3H96_11830 [Acidobacteria bacterium RIFCSPLOWO2_02_FULL_67_36]|nr:MAG: hypothetical protein A3H96_11830 [Acidobacteria bacterium RIFCSPLOWO2_02_FULL_67_36]OFW22388.1 MAG: hypothetical protein A3G21_21380 [Acidobacteria bacterium RIFCSPLOWO2_12_FULL_66_21]